MIESMLPVNVGAETLVATSTDGTQPIAPPDPARIPIPPDLALWEQESYQLTAEVAATLGFPIWGVDSKTDVRVMIFGISRYADVQVDSHTFRYGTGIRVLLEIVDTENKAQVTLPAIAAQVQLEGLKANSQLLVSGYVGDISADLPAWQAFDVQTYSDYMASINKLQARVFGDTANMRSVLLSSTAASTLVPPGDRDKNKRHGLHWL
jgi:hypothetical protein